MNTILGVFLLIYAGQIEGAKTVGAYPTNQACQAAVSAYIQQQVNEKGAPPQGVTLAKMCVDLTDELKAAPHVQT